MSIKALFFALLLYISLVWVGGVWLYQGANAWPKIRSFGLLWTIVGISTVLAFIIFGRLYAFWRAWRAKAATRKATVREKPQQAPMHEDDAAFSALIAEANAALAASPAYSRTPFPLRSLPVYLLIGPEGSGKTSTFINSGLGPQLLAGQLGTAGALSSTRLANIWLAGNAVFIEIGGRAFSGDLSRWTALLRVLRGNATKLSWRNYWREPDPAVTISGVVAFCEAKNFTGSVNVDRLTRDGRHWHERLGAIGEVFGIEYPVYQVITKCDSIPFFGDYFQRLPEVEANQVLGCTFNGAAATARSGESAADAEGRRLSRSFTSLFNSLAERRLIHLAHEPDLKRRAGMYEFPREFKRLRPALVQFLTDAFRPHPLRPGPVLRGYYMTGVREMEGVPVDPGATRVDWSVSEIAGDASRLFRGDATQIFRPDDLQVKTRGAFGTVRRWMFTSDLFQNIVLVDRPARPVVSVNAAFEKRRRFAVAAACAACGVLCVVWLSSWAGNRRLLRDVHLAATAPALNGPAAASIDGLRALDGLRSRVARLLEYERDGAPWSIRWGLYSGDRVADAARKAYFRRFQQLILNDLNGAIVSDLQARPEHPSGDGQYEPVYRELATHMMISSASCKPDAKLVSAVLKETSNQNASAAGSEAKILIDRQIDFYASELPYGNPCRLSENEAARDRARSYLARVKGVDRIYSGILAKVEKQVTTSRQLKTLAPEYTKVLSGEPGVSDVFTPEGWALMEKASRETHFAELGDACVVGAIGPGGESQPDDELIQEIRKRYIRDYIDHWRKFVASFSVKQYGGAEDAAKKLEILSGHRSPLLAVLALTSNATDLRNASEGNGGLDRLKSLPVIKEVVRVGKSVDQSGVEIADPSNEATPVQITRVFQPVHEVVPPRSETWVVDRNSAYIDALAQLSHSMRDIARSREDPAAQQAAAQNYDKAIDTVRQIARSFKPVGVEGMDAAVQNLIEQPIRLTNRFIIRDMEKAAAAKVNAELRKVCIAGRGTFSRYPFNPSGEDATLQEVGALFAPGGSIWKFEAESLSDLVVKEGSEWKAKDPSKKPQVTPQMLAFLNHAQQFTDVFYAGGSSQPKLTFVLRPRLDAALKDSILELDVDGRSERWTSSLQKQFTWPAPPGTKELGAVARISKGGFMVPVASRGGVWGIFRIMADAEPRPLSSKIVEWRRVRGGGGRLEPLSVPVRLEVVEFPGGVDVFNPKFFERLQCPQIAVQ